MNIYRESDFETEQIMPIQKVNSGFSKYLACLAERNIRVNAVVLGGGK